METKNIHSAIFDSRYEVSSTIYTYLRHHWVNLAALTLVVIILRTLYGRFASPCLDNSHRSSDDSDDPAKQTIFLPYTKPFSREEIPMVNATVAGVEIEMPMDTGSIGILIGAPLLPHIDTSKATPAYQYFSSSKILYNGRLVDLPVKFHGRGPDSYAIATVPVLVVDWSVVCPWYDPAVDTFECPPNPDEPEPVLRDVSHITYMGVGFGRNRRGSEQPNTLPSANPFLNIESIDGKPVAKDFKTGYTISTKGVHLGLTEEDERGFAWSKLEPGLTHDDDRRDWAMVKTCFSVDGGSDNCGSALIDTGIQQLYLKAVEGVETPNVTIPNPNPDGNAKFVNRVKTGTKIEIGFSRLNGTVGRYGFKVGGETKMAPSYVVPLKQGDAAFVNTGRNFLFGYTVAFDATGGRFGFRRVS
ncbi:hypothetical protein BDV96DRAFT_164285 [Lophiotrema nucula]|uniref:Aspartic peptidase domain-containing protein n=1 Tax=Lophiotrema nucula TaxID=690887 RepID=A0A6A5YXN1_9PLEO|nr:hypothetical protein BDV96DRAFT_164285 [Lophiotrema nucula]